MNYAYNFIIECRIMRSIEVLFKGTSVKHFNQEQSG